MKASPFAIVALTVLFASGAGATVAGGDVNEVVLAAELTFAAASSYAGLSNVQQGYAGDRSLPAALFGLSVGVTSLILSADSDAEIPALDVGAGILAVVGSVVIAPRARTAESRHAAGPALAPGDGAHLAFAAGFRRLGIRLTF